MEKGLCLCKCIVLILCGIFFFNLQEEVLANEEYLTLNQGILQALEHSLDYKMALLNWENAMIQEKITALDPPKTEEERIRLSIDQKGVERDLEVSLIDIILNTTKDYLKIESLALQVEIAELQLKQAFDSYNLMKEKVAVGYLGERNLLEEENRLKNAEISFDRALLDYEREKDSFLLGLGILDKSVEIVPMNNLEMPVIPYSFSQAKVFFLESNFSLWERERRLRLSEINLEKMRVQGAGALEIQIAENRHQIDVYNLEKSILNLEDQFRRVWYNLEESERRLEMAYLDLLLAREEHSQKEKEYQMALITDTEIIRSEIALLSAQRSYIERKHSHYTEILTLLKDLGFSIQPLFEEQGEQEDEDEVT